MDINKSGAKYSAIVGIGEKIKLITPSKQAYGEYGYEKIIPPFATLIFEIKLVDIQ